MTVIAHLEGGRERTRRCLEALAALDDEPTFEAILVDDASPDLGELLAGLSGDVKVLRNERREGFVASAIRAADAAASPTLVLLRGPALLSPAALRHLDVDGPKTRHIGGFSAHQRRPFRLAVTSPAARGSVQ
jgi:hypothetical protein